MVQDAVPMVLVRLDARAPVQPALGAACNGCGVCCAMEPCPVGRAVTGKRTGACAALVWDEPNCVYRCGVLTQPQAMLMRLGLPSVLTAALAPLLRVWARRAIAAGKGCDCPSRAVPG